jgi:hypothetical protein
MPSFRRAGMGLAFLAIFLAGCSTDFVDAAKLEGSIKEGIEASTDFTVIEVDCPQDRPFKLGDVFTCKAKINDGRTLIVQVTNENGGGNLRYEVTGVE